MSTDEERRIRADLLLRQEDLERSLKCCQAKTDQIAKTLSMVITILRKPDDQWAWRQVRQHFGLPETLTVESIYADPSQWCATFPTAEDIMTALRDLQQTQDELTRVQSLLT